MKIQITMILAALILSIGLAIEPSQAKEEVTAGQLLELYDHDGMDEGARQEFELTVSHMQTHLGGPIPNLGRAERRHLFSASRPN
jgi:hypothetical protein